MAISSLWSFSMLHAQWTDAILYAITADTLEDKLGPHSLRVDDYNILHVMYLKERTDGGYNIYYDRRNPEGVWNGATLINEITEQVAEADFGVYGQDTLYFAYTRITPEGPQLQLSTLDGPFKTTVSIGDTLVSDFRPACQVDGEGRVHILYTSNNGSSDKLYYVNNALTEFFPIPMTFATLTTPPESSYPDFVVTDEGAVHICHRGGLGGDATQYIFNTGINIQDWAYYSVLNSPENSIKARISIGPENQIQIALTGSDGLGNPLQTKLYKRISGIPVSWEPGEEIVPENTGQIHSIFTGRSGFSIAGVEGVNSGLFTGQVIAAMNSSGSWTSESLLDDGYSFEPQIILDNIDQGYAIIRSQAGDASSSEILLWGKATTEPTTPLSSISTISLKEISVYPNPAQQDIYFNLAGEEMLEIKLSDLAGKTIDADVVFGNDGGVYKVHFKRDLLPGIYILSLHGKHSAYRARIIKL